MNIEKFSLGIGDRFGLEGVAQLRALQKAEAEGAIVVPVWNKSNREHTIIGTVPDDVRGEADAAVKMCGWKHSYYVDADHIGFTTVEKFLNSSNFFTIDVADYIGKEASQESVEGFLRAMDDYTGILSIPGIPAPFEVNDSLLKSIARKYLYAIEEAGKVYRAIAAKKGEGNFITEVSVDEASSPQTPAELFFILAALAQEKVPIQTIAPKFTGSFLKGIDYVGDIKKFAREFEDDLAVIAYAIKTFKLPQSLKLSVHSGSDKFSLYSIMHQAVKKSGAGLHLKTAGTTWLEEIIGLAAAGGEGLVLAKDVYAQAIQRYDELCKPYLTVIDINKAKLPDPKIVASWSSQQYVAALQHNQSSDSYDRNFRQLVHVSFRIAAEMGQRYLGLLKECRKEVEENVATNLYERHIKPLFLGIETNVFHETPRHEAARV
ncbi:MAG: tagaturonate epimerase family protein [Ignavibacteriae bacterium]|nr:tagaturonate epimerase family protein [Ignavibacteriota bacterium]